MKKYIALLRGINVGGNGKLPMKELTAMLESLGCRDVQTYIQSGNAVFRAEGTAALLTTRIRDIIQKEKGFSPAILLLTDKQFAEVIAANPYPTDEGKALHFFFLFEKPAKPDLDGLKKLKAASEDFTLTGSVFYLHAPDGIGRSKLVEKVDRCLGVETTARNWNTIAALATM